MLNILHRDTFAHIMSNPVSRPRLVGAKFFGSFHQVRGLFSNAAILPAEPKNRHEVI